MNNLIDKIVEEMYSDKLTMYNLLSNINEENYISVNFKKENDLVVCETQCIKNESNLVTYLYKFKDGQLLSLVEVYDGVTTDIYDRSSVLEELLETFKNDKLSSQTVSA